MIISIGLQCTNYNYKKNFKPSCFLPFDLMFATPSFVFDMLELLLEKNMDIELLVREHFFYCKKRANMNGSIWPANAEHYYTSDEGFALYNEKYNVIFPHDENNEESIDKYIRRFTRLKDIILNTQECLFFTYTSQSSLEDGNFTIDGNNVVCDVYNSLSKIYDLIGKFRNNYKMVVFDTINEEPLHLLNENIIYCKLKRCNYLNDLIPQMNEYKYLFE